MDQETPSIDHADASILESWNTIREATPTEDVKEPVAKESAAESEPTEKTDRARAPNGKFAKAEPAASEPIEPTEPAPAEQKPPVESPKSLRKEIADKHWSTLNPEIQAAWNERDASYQQGIERYRTRAESYDKVEAAFAPYMETLGKLGAQPEQAVSQLLGIDHILRTGEPQVKAALLSQIANQFGVPLQDIAGVGPLQQQLLASQQELLAYRSQQTVAKEQQAQRELDTLTSEVVKFSEGKEHFNAVSQEMYAVLPSISQQFPSATAAEKLQRAYDIAIHANPQVRASLEAQQRETARQDALKKAVEAKKAASVNRTPRGVIGSAPAVTSMDDTIRAKAKELGLA